MAVINENQGTARMQAELIAFLGRPDGAATALQIAGMEQVDGGYRIAETSDYVIDLQRMLFNLRLVVSRAEDYDYMALHGYCYFGTGRTAFLAAAVAGFHWTDPLNTAPLAFNKKAY